MNEEYLWDKTGEDTDIELLENALQTFRYHETAPPVLPAKIIPFAPKNSRRIFRFAFAFSACAALMIICLSVWFYASAKNSTLAQGKIKTNFDLTPPTATKAAAPIVENPTVSTPKFINTNVRSDKKSFAVNYAVERKILKNVKRSRLNSTQAKNIAPKENPVKLTEEEKFAYDQLMLALSITSSKLKIVKDKAEGSSKEENSFSDGK